MRLRARRLRSSPDSSSRLRLCSLPGLPTRYRDRLSTLERLVEPLFLVAGMAWWTLASLDQIDRRASGDRVDALLVGWARADGRADDGGGVAAGLAGDAARRAPAAADAGFSGLHFPVVDGHVAAIRIGRLDRVGRRSDSLGRLSARVRRTAPLARSGPLAPRRNAVAAGLRGHAEATWHLRLLPMESVWPALPAGLVPVLFALATLAAIRAGRWPFGPWARAYVELGVGGLLAFAAAWGTLMVGWSADPSPLPYLPIANPLDLTLGLGVAAMAMALRVARTREMLSAANLRRVGWIAVALVFVWLNATLARSVHVYAGVAYDLNVLLASSTFQSAVTIFWSAVGVVAMTIAARRHNRLVWQASAVLLGLAVLKLFLVDLSNLSLLVRIGTFLVVGIFLIGVGYLAPAPPKNDAPAPDVSSTETDS